MTLHLLCLPVNGWALGVGNPSTLSSLGESLVLRFPVSLNPGESLGADCVRAEVWVGDHPVPPKLLQLQIVGGSDPASQALLIQAALPMQEPIVSITLKLGCPARLTRQYTAFIDPSKTANPSSASLAQRPLPQQDGIVAAQFTPQPFSPALSAALASAQASSAVPQTAGIAGSTGAAKVARPLKMVGAAETGNTDNMARQLAAASRVVNKPPRRVAPTIREVKVSASAGPKLRLEMPASLDLLLQPVALPGGTDKPDPSLQRLQQVEADLALLSQGNNRIEAQLLALKTQHSAAKSAQSVDPVVLGFGLVLVGLAGGGFYFWRSRRAGLAAAEYPSWHSEVPRTDTDASATAQRPGGGTVEAVRATTAPVTGAANVAAAAAVATRASIQPDELTINFSKLMDSQLDQEPAQSAAVPDAAAQTSPAYAFVHDFSHEPLSVQFVDSSLQAATPAWLGKPYDSSAASASGHQTVIEDLIDLEQQVEFFLVLGQDDAAEELLLTRVNTGLTSALPYLKLLEIYQRLGRESAFEGMAARFAVRFKALPPTWGANLNLGLSLEGYPEVLRELQAAWTNHGNAMVKVQALLSGGTEQSTGFDLPAYLDLLLLYSLARELSEHEVRGEEIDLFLPLDVEAVSPNVDSMMVTMNWQGSPVAPGAAIDLDISLDDLPPGQR